MFQFPLPYPQAVKIAKKLAHSVSKDEHRPALNGFFMHEKEGMHYAVSTDGHMLTRIEISPQYGEQPEDTAIMRIPVHQEAFPYVIFPALAIKQIEQIKLNPHNRRGMPVTFFIEQDSYRIECYDQIFVGKLIDGAFPDYARVIPEGWEAFPNEYGKCGFSPIYIAAIMKAVSFCPEQFKATANPMRMFFSDGNPAVIQETRDPGIIYVIMPIRIGLLEHRNVEQAESAETEEPVVDDQPEPVPEPVAEPAAYHLIRYQGHHAGPKDTGGSTTLYDTPEEALSRAETCAYPDERCWVNPEFVGPLDTSLRAVSPIDDIDWAATTATKRRTIKAGEIFTVGDIMLLDRHITRATVGGWIEAGRRGSYDPPPHPRHPHCLPPQILELREQGLFLVEIGKRVGYSRGAVGRALRGRVKE